VDAGRPEGRATVAGRRHTARALILLVTVTVLVAAALVVVLPQVHFGSANAYHANFAEAAGLRAGQSVRIATVPVGEVDAVDLASDNSVNVSFTVPKTYQLYTSTRALIRHENVVGDRYLEITMGPGELHKLPVGATINQAHTATVLVEQTGPLVTTPDGRKVEIEATTGPLAENYLRLNALGAYGYFFNVYYCSIQMRINGPGCPRSGAAITTLMDGERQCC
jgi:hypothetical protein